jgi:muramoyltetrapeptide carboxypeptidase
MAPTVSPEAVLAGLTEPPRGTKVYHRLQRRGFVLAGLYTVMGSAGPCTVRSPHDIRRAGGEAAVARALAWLVDGDRAALEPSLKPGQKAAAFNITVLSQLLGTPLQPDLTGHVLLLEDVGEYMYRLDRSLFHLTSNPGIREVVGIRLGRCSDIPQNDPDFGMTAEEVCRHWCDRSGIPFLGRADIGHDADNRIVPFGPYLNRSL